MSASPTASPEIIEADQIFKDAHLKPNSADDLKMSGTQVAGLLITVPVTALILLVITVMLTFWSSTTPPLPKLPANPTVAKATIENYKILADAVHGDLLKLFAALGAPLITLLGTIIGYVLGNQAKKSE